MTAEWRAIAKTPHYEVSDVGEIRNAKYDRILTPSKNQFGHLKVNLPTPEGKIRTRQVNHIVAEAFIPEPNRDDFISIIHLNGDKTNCAAVNMQWRPRYFAIRYHLQFQTDLWRDSHITIEDIKNGRIYNRIQDAAVEHGLVLSEILVAAHKRTFVWPTYQQFRIVE